ncbi:MAG TPA: hypothetical protein VGP24_04350 [Glaciihabitans sp.]|nr:hypothetical protein [Glaciihabitans sp.]
MRRYDEDAEPMRAQIALVAALVSCLMLASCAPGAAGNPVADDVPSATSTGTVAATSTPNSGATGSSIPTSSPTPTAAEAPAVPVSILIGAEATDFVDATGNTVLSLRYSEDGDDAVADVTDLLGVADRTVSDPATGHTSPVDLYYWGGFALAVHRYLPTDGRNSADQNYVSAFSVQATEATTPTGISIVALDGTQVGTTLAAASEGKPEVQLFKDTTFGVDAVAVDLPTSFPGVVFDGQMEIAYGVIASTGEGTDVIETLQAPRDLFYQY